MGGKEKEVKHCWLFLPRLFLNPQLLPWLELSLVVLCLSAWNPVL